VYALLHLVDIFEIEMFNSTGGHIGSVSLALWKYLSCFQKLRSIAFSALKLLTK
jgi:hypothetical protein